MKKIKFSPIKRKKEKNQNEKENEMKRETKKMENVEYKK